MSYYQTCPRCGSHLDPGERCDCRDEDEEAAASTRNTDGGGVEHGDRPVPSNNT